MFSDPGLAINGGEPVRTAPWRHNVTTGAEEIRAVREVLESGYLSLFEGSHMPDPPFSFWGGPRVQQLEAEWGAYYKVPHAVAMNSATSGLYAAVGALGLGYGDEIITSPYTMSACAVCTLAYGAIPIFADVELETGCLDPASIEAHVTERTRAVLVVHQFGFPADMLAIMDIAHRHGLKVIEDCAQAHGAIIAGRPVGTFGDIGVFSLNVNKTIQVGEGGVCVTDDPELHYRLALIRNHGEAVVGPAGYEDITNILGFNFRMTELHAAIAIEQLRKLESLNRVRLEYVEYLQGALAKCEGLSPLIGREGDRGEGYRASYYLFPLRFREEIVGVPRADFVAAANAEGAGLSEGYTQPLYLQPIYQRLHAFKHGYPFSAPENAGAHTNYHRGAAPNAERLHFSDMVLSEHVRPPNTLEDIKDVERAIRKVLGARS